MRWEVTPDFPDGHLVPLTASEEIQLQTDRAAAAQAAAAQAVLDSNQSALRQEALNRLAQIRAARTALAGGGIFAALSTNEKAVIDGLLQDDLYLIRLTLELFDAAN